MHFFVEFVRVLSIFFSKKKEGKNISSPPCETARTAASSSVAGLP